MILHVPSDPPCISYQPELPGHSYTHRSFGPSTRPTGSRTPHWAPSSWDLPPAGIQAEGQLDGVRHQGRNFEGQHHHLLPWTRGLGLGLGLGLQGLGWGLHGCRLLGRELGLGSLQVSRLRVRVLRLISHPCLGRE